MNAVFRLGCGTHYTTPIAMTDTERFLIALAIIFGLPYAIWRLGHTDYWAPLVVVQIITGIVLGPGLLGAVFPACYHAVFEPRMVQALNGVAWWGVMLFVWIAGIELDLKEVWRQRRECGTTARWRWARRCCSAPWRRQACWPGAAAGSARAATTGSSCWAWAWPARSPPCRSWCC
ncbi:cation:proton antiporter domain-containing protein [Metallibacterium sp.]